MFFSIDSDCKNNATIYIINHMKVYNWNCLLAELSPEEQHQVNKFHFYKDKVRYAVSHWLLRKVLSSYLNCSCEELVFSIGEFGKPYLENTHKIHFNLSHSDDISVLIVSKRSKVGVDVDSKNKLDRLDIDVMVESVLSLEEKKIFHDLNCQDKCNLFMKLWVLKESYLKFLGFGLVYNIPELTFIIKGGRIQLFSLHEEITQCSFGLTEYADNVIAWSIEGKIKPILKYLN
ncbi:4'-phosphopantetheinyl transferase superfamily protein [Vibrio lentus]|uniref:4'-phosphopantetheinyl transferase family protein n=1 Tax=Vibrio lentus TaxID=136468 RepID=UPI002468C90D|nr:4'-phosphopantetheinyl transferase superfamily protein [Vibrio lentus]MDH5929532.1 4'-phosphopantetheinyl transferase superfamily protein [Vibrio lentus]